MEKEDKMETAGIQETDQIQEEVKYNLKSKEINKVDEFLSNTKTDGMDGFFSSQETSLLYKETDNMGALLSTKETDVKDKFLKYREIKDVDEVLSIKETDVADEFLKSKETDAVNEFSSSKETNVADEVVKSKEIDVVDEVVKSKEKDIVNEVLKSKETDVVAEVLKSKETDIVDEFLSMCVKDKLDIKYKDTDSDLDDESDKYLVRGLKQANKGPSHRYNPWNSMAVGETFHISAFHESTGVLDRKNSTKSFDQNKNNFIGQIPEANVGIYKNPFYGIPSPEHSSNDITYNAGQYQPAGYKGVGFTSNMNYNYFENSKTTGRLMVENQLFNNLQGSYLPVFEDENSTRGLGLGQFENTPLVDHCQNQPLTPEHEVSEERVNDMINDFLDSGLTLDPNYSFDEMDGQLRSVLDEDAQDDGDLNKICDDFFKTSSNSYTPLTPPSVSPPPSVPTTDFGETDKHDQIQVLLYGIDQISPNEMNIYLPMEKKAMNLEDEICKFSTARRMLKRRCNNAVLEKMQRRLKMYPREKSWTPDEEGDMSLHITCSQLESSDSFYDRLMCLQSELMFVWHCCGQPIGTQHYCNTCGQTDKNQFYTPLSFKNDQGYSPLVCSLKTGHSGLVIQFLMHGLLLSHNNIQRVFDSAGVLTIAKYVTQFPFLKRFVAQALN